MIELLNSLTDWTTTKQRTADQWLLTTERLLQKHSLSHEEAQRIIGRRRSQSQPPTPSALHQSPPSPTERMAQGNEEADRESVYYKLLQFLMKGGVEIVLVVGTKSRGSDEEPKIVDSLCKAMDAYNYILPFLLTTISNEVKETTQFATLLRGNNATTKLLLGFLKTSCSRFLLPLQPLIEECKEKSGDLEVDPNKTQADTNVAMDCLIDITMRFYHQIKLSLSEMPAIMRQLMQHLRFETDGKFEGKGKRFAGAFIFLRFVCPALISPEKYNLCSTEVPLDQRTGLKYVSKTLQYAANNVKFREPHCLRLNQDFLDVISSDLEEFFEKITVRFLLFSFRSFLSGYLYW